MSLKTMYRNVEDVRGTLLLVQDQAGRVFGGYNTESWKSRASGYYGTGESFVFAIHPSDTPALKRFAWSGENQFFMTSTVDGIGMGGGTNFAFWLDKEIFQGTSGPCNTFNAPRLSSTDQFQVLNFEIWGSE